VIGVSRSSATVAIDTFITELSSAIRNCPADSASSTVPAAATATDAALDWLATSRTFARRPAGGRYFEVLPRQVRDASNRIGSSLVVEHQDRRLGAGALEGTQMRPRVGPEIADPELHLPDDR
jgi:hypothetical protein